MCPVIQLGVFCRGDARAEELNQTLSWPLNFIRLGQPHPMAENTMLSGVWYHVLLWAPDAKYRVIKLEGKVFRCWIVFTRDGIIS